MHGLPIRPQFSERLPRKEVLRKKLGMLQSAPTVMMAGGGEGMGNLEATLKAMVGKLSPDAQVNTPWLSLPHCPWLSLALSHCRQCWTHRW
jgi:UDP-N-acetylglucosamine:LPS N-acetylglucosamine transferase